MKKSKLLITLGALFSTFCISAFAACASENEHGNAEPEEIYGFDVAETLTVTAGESVLVDIPVVTDKSGAPLEVVYEVVTANGGYVSVSSNRFFATDAAGYLIDYAVTSRDNAIHEKSTKVNVLGAGDLYAEYEAMADVGSRVEIKPISKAENPEYTYSVKFRSTGETVMVHEPDETTKNYYFTAEKLGFYTVTIFSAAAGEAPQEYTYDIYSREAMTDGEVECFTPEWERVRELCGMDTFGWEVTNTRETGVPDRFGREANYLKTTTSEIYGYYWVNPRGDEAYYRQLYKEGYTGVSFWVYNAGNVNHDVICQLYKDRGAYTEAIGKVTPGIWTQITVRLVETPENDYSGSFASAIEYFKKQQTHILQFDNAAGWNSGGHEEDMTLYIADVYAVKPADIKAAENAKLDYKTGETAKISELVSLPEDVKAEYTITFRGKTQTIAANEAGEYEYAFKANGTYTLKVVPTPNISTSLTLTLNVTDDVVSNVSDVQRERTGETYKMDFASLGVTLTANDAPVKQKAYKVYRYGKAVDCTAESFETGADGAYTVEIEGEYTQNGETYTTYYSVITDIWSEKTKNIVSDGELMIAHSEYCGWLNWDTHPAYNLTADKFGEKGRMFEVTKLGQTYLILMLPMYSKGYYEKLLSENPNATVTLKYYASSENDGNSIRSYFDNFESKGYVRNRWVYDTVTLEKFVNDYDKLVSGYNDVKYLMDYNIIQRHDRSRNDYLMWFSGDLKGSGEKVYIADILVTNEAASGEATAKPGATLKVGEENDLTKLLCVTLNGAPATIANIDAIYEGQTINLGDKTFKPYFGGEYRFRIYAVSGSTYKTLECTLFTDEAAIEKTTDTALHTISAAQQLDLTKYTKSGYEIDYRIERMTGKQAGEISCVIENNVLAANALGAPGSYKITVILAANRNSAFGTIGYYELTLDYVGEETGYSGVNTDTASYAKAWNNWGSSEKPYAVSAEIVRDPAIGAGEKTGDFFKTEVKPRWAIDTDVVGVQILPLYSKAYYESLLADGQNYNLTFDWLYHCTYEYAEPVTSFWRRPFGTKNFSQDGAFDTWYSETIDLKTLLENWDTLTNIVKIETGDRYLRELLTIRTSGGAKHNETVGELYIGNFRLVKRGVVETNVQLVDVKGKEMFDLTSLYKGAGAVATATLTDRYGNVQNAENAKALSLAGLKQGVYEITVYENGAAAYTANVDFYNSADGLVWQELDENSVNDAEILRYGYIRLGEAQFAKIGEDKVLSFTIREAEGGTNQVGMRLRAIHSKAYYEMMSENYSAIKFSVYVTGGMNIKLKGTEGEKGYGVWQAKGTWAEYSIDLSYLLENWEGINTLGRLNMDSTLECQLFTTYFGAKDKDVVSIGRFGSVAKAEA